MLDPDLLDRLSSQRAESGSSPTLVVEGLRRRVPVVRARQGRTRGTRDDAVLCKLGEDEGLSGGSE